MSLNNVTGSKSIPQSVLRAQLFRTSEEEGPARTPNPFQGPQIGTAVVIMHIDGYGQICGTKGGAKPELAVINSSPTVLCTDVACKICIPSEPVQYTSYPVEVVVHQTHPGRWQAIPNPRAIAGPTTLQECKDRHCALCTGNLDKLEWS